jgi:NADPH:quinone reductase-like Zn-dependent oxidoreductase
LRCYFEAMARVVRFHEFGGPDVLRIEDLPVPVPGPNEVRIAVRAIGLNRAEVLFRENRYDPATLPASLGYEGAGIVDAVGANVRDFAIGDAVSVVPSDGGIHNGSYAEMMVVPAAFVVKHAPALSFEEAAAAWVQYLTAYGALIDVAGMTRGDVVVISAASSSVGIATIQLANLVGAVPIATTRGKEKRAALIAAGAAHVIVTDDEPIAERIRAVTDGAGARIVFDPIGGPIVKQFADGMARGGLFIAYGVLSPDPTPFPVWESIRNALSLRGYSFRELARDETRRNAAVRFINAALASGGLRPRVARTFPLESIADAHRYLESNAQFGKVVVTV